MDIEQNQNKNRKKNNWTPPWANVSVFGQVMVKSSKL